MIHKKVSYFVGDNSDIREALNCYNYKLKECQAQLLVNMICEHEGWPEHKVKYTGKVTKKVAGSHNYDKKLIIIHKPFENVQTIIHELTHYITDNHDKTFKKIQLQLIEVYKNNLKIIFEGVNVDGKRRC
jgi:predicted metal-dependent hydrolase